MSAAKYTDLLWNYGEGIEDRRNGGGQFPQKRVLSGFSKSHLGHFISYYSIFLGTALSGAPNSI